jgi:hypothetical protein
MQARFPSLIRALIAAPYFLSLILVAPVYAEQSEEHIQLAAAFELPQIPGLPSLTGPSADWRQFDSFFTFVVKRFGDDVPANLKDSLGDAFLDSRYELTGAIAPGRGGNPVPELFVNGWRRLSPIINQALPALPQQTASLYSNFIGAADKLALTGSAGLNLTPDALRGMARLLSPSSAADPLAYSTKQPRPAAFFSGRRGAGTMVVFFCAPGDGGGTGREKSQSAAPRPQGSADVLE